jgi:histidyl-tRNA synthetase
MTIIDPKLLKGTREFGPEDMKKRNFVIQKVTKIFRQFGYGQIETPILNLAETILGKYGAEGDKLTYNFEDRGGRRLALPYDLTVPFAKYFAANNKQLELPFKRYQLQRVWRADKPQKGRFREFYQCDIDVIGTDSLMVDAEIIKVIDKVFEGLGFKNIKIRVNSRKLINEILQKFEIKSPVEVIRKIDKLDKIGRSELEKLLAEDIEDPKKLTNIICDLNLEGFDTSEIDRLFELTKKLGVDESRVQFDPSLARGLDYYTGTIIEVISEDNKDLGSICGGGRYANLCGTFTKESFSGMGVSFGLDRILVAMEENALFKEEFEENKVLVTIFEEQYLDNSLEIFSQLTEAGVNAEIYLNKNDKLKKQLKFADRKNINFVLIQGPDEIANKSVVIKDMKMGGQKEIKTAQLVTFLKNYE